MWHQSFPHLCIPGPKSGLPVWSAIDTVERFQGGERTLILVSATESDRAYLLASCEFLLDPHRLAVALSQTKRKMILVASRSSFSPFSADEQFGASVGMTSGWRCGAAAALALAKFDEKGAWLWEGGPSC